MEITTDMIKELRAATNAGILDCRKALTEANGDFQKAVDWLREKGMATAAKRADREASQGVVELYWSMSQRLPVPARKKKANLKTSPRKSCRDVSKSLRMKLSFHARYTFAMSQSQLKS